MASAALDWSWSSEPTESDAQGRVSFSRTDRRLDEESVRILLIEERPTFVPVVCWALDHADRGRFQLEQTTALQHAKRLLCDDLYDAILVDLGDREGARAHEAMDAAEALAQQVPVIVLTGTCFDGFAPVTRDEDLAALVAREQLACDRLPCAILDAIRRHRRVGQGGADPVIVRLHH